MPIDIATTRDRLENLRTQLANERSSFLSHWRAIGDYILPRRPRFTVTDVNRGERRNLNIIDSTGSTAARTLSSGMMAGITSPARPWFRLTTSDPRLAEVTQVKTWLHDVTTDMQTVFLRSNLYNVLPTVYLDLGSFATGAMLIEEDFEDVVRFYPFPIGSYMIANDERLRVRVFFREFRYTVRQVVEKFTERDPRTGEIDFSNVSQHVQDLYKRGQLEAWIDVNHAIYPNPDFRPNNPLAKFKRFASVYYEAGKSSAQGGPAAVPLPQDKFLRRSGYDRFHVLAPRWQITGEDAYGTDCPGMEALGDVKQLQLGEKRIMEAIEKMVRPPMKGPAALQHVRTSILAGDITYVNERQGEGKFEPAHQVDPRVQELEFKQDQTRGRVKRVFYEDLFLMLHNSDRREITAFEIEKRQEEKLLALGPVLEQLNQDLLDPLIDITFDMMLRQGRIPPPPEELEGVELKVEYTSIMAQAQKAVGIGGIERLARFTGELIKATDDISVLDKVDLDQMIDEYHLALGTPPRIVRSDEDVAEIREARAEAERQQAAAEQAKTVTGAVKDLAGADLEKDSALKRLMQQARAGQLVA